MAISKAAPEQLEEHELWLRFLTRKVDKNRQALALYYAAWVRQVARQVFLRWQIPGAEWADYVHYGTLGLLESIDRFEPGHGAQFKTYARYRVKGAIINGIKKFGPAALEAGKAAFRDRTASLLDSKERDPLEEIITVSVGLTVGHLLDIESMQSSAIAEGGYARLEEEEMQVLLMKYVDQLPEKERVVVTLHYLQQLSFTEVAGHLKLSKGRISQLHKQGIERIRQWLKAAQTWDLIV